MVPAHIVLRMREKRGVAVGLKYLIDFTALYPIATEHAAVEEALGRRFSALTKARFWFNMYSQSLL